MRKLALILTLLSASVCAFGQGTIVPPQTAFKSINGVTMPIANATITVCAATTAGIPCSPVLANALFSDTALSQPLPNPFTADANGNYQFAIAAGTYTVTVTAAGFSGYSYQITVGGGGSSGGGGAGTGPLLQTYANCTTSGTITNGAVQLSSQTVAGVQQACVTATPVGSTSSIGICNSGCGNSGTASIAYQGSQSCVFTNQTTINDIAAPSATIAGECDDVGSTRVAGTQSIGRISSINTGGGTLATVNLFTGDVIASGAQQATGTVNNASQGLLGYYSNPGSGNQISGDSCTTDGNGNVTCTSLSTRGTGTGTLTYGIGVAPSLPTAGNGTTYIDSRSNLLTCLPSGGGDCVFDWTDVKRFGAFADGTQSHTLIQADINSNTQWLGCGLATASGTTLTWSSGAKFYATLAGYNINFNGADFAVSSVAALSAGSATTLTLGSSAGTVSTPTRWCMYSTGDQWDYVALQESIFASLGAPGAEHGSASAANNKNIFIPAGQYELNKSLNITGGVGVYISGAQQFATKLVEITNNTPLLVTNGLSSSTIRGLYWTTVAGATADTSHPLIDLNWDNGSQGNALQEIHFVDNFVTGPTALGWNYGLYLARSGFMGSENTFVNNRFSWFSNSCYIQNGFNSLQNKIIGGNISNCPSNGMTIFQGSLSIYDVGFQNGATPTAQTGCDIHHNSSANSIITVVGSRSESMHCFMDSAGGGATFAVESVHQTPGLFVWSANTPCSTFNNKGIIPPANTTQGISGLFTTVSNSGNTGGSEPTWSYTTTTDGSCTWTYTPLTFVKAFGPLSINNSNTPAGTVYLAGAPASSQTSIRNSYFGGPDWLQSGSSLTASPWNSGSPVMVQLDNDTVWRGGVGNGGTLQKTSGPWATALSVAGNAGRFLQDYAPHTMGDQPACWDWGTSGLFSSDVCLGLGRNPSATSVIYPEAILAVIGPSPPSGSNVKFGRQDAFGSNQSASFDQDIAGGRGTGTGAGSNINFWTSPAGGSGSSVNALVKQLTISPTGNMSFVAGKGQHFNTQAAQSDLAGVATCSTGTIAVSFTTAYTSTPVIVVSDETTAGGARVSAKSNTGFTITCTGASDVVDYITHGNPN